MVKLDILSDPICPWCYIGKASLERALERNPGHPFIIEWHPFMLNPDMPPEGRVRAEYLAERLGADGVEKADAMLAERAAEAGVTINRFDGQKIPNTLDAHRMIHWAGLEGRQNAMVNALFRANFVEGRDIGDREVLTDLAGQVGLDAAMMARLLASDADIENTRARDAHARKMGVSAVPTFIVGQRHAVQGAQPPELWDKVIADLAEMSSNEATDGTPDA